MQVDINAPLAILLVSALGGLVWISKWTGGVNEHKSEVSKFMQEIRDDVKKIFRRLPSKTLDRGSPLHLTDLGIDVASQIEAHTWAGEQAKALRARVAGWAAYRIQNFAFEYVRDEYEPDEVFESQLEEVAYQKGVSKEEVLDVLAIALRDELAGPEADFDTQK